MAQFVHLTDLNNLSSIRRRGLRAPKSGLFAMPTLPDFSISHQWLRELRRCGANRICAVYFRVPDDQVVSVGHYASELQTMPAAQAIAAILQADSGIGYQVLLHQSVPKSAIFKVANIKQVTGWRYAPDVRQRSRCNCPFCVPPGSRNSRRKRDPNESAGD